MRQRSLIVAATVSALILITVLVLWGRSYRTEEQLSFSYQSKAYRLVIRSGATIIDNHPEIAAQTEREEKARRAIASVPGSVFLLFVPRGERVIDPPSHIPLPWSKSSYIPLPTAAVLLAVLPAVVLVQWRRRRNRVKQGLCPHCGYNLTGNTSGVCPECGFELALTIVR